MVYHTYICFSSYKLLYKRYTYKKVAYMSFLDIGCNKKNV